MNNIEKKTIVYWLGLILVGFSVWGFFILLWILAITKMYYIAKYSWLILVVGIIIFLPIGLRMMKEAKRKNGEEDQRRE